jgi:hypothetical protein
MNPSRRERFFAQSTSKFNDFQQHYKFNDDISQQPSCISPILFDDLFMLFSTVQCIASVMQMLLLREPRDVIRTKDKFEARTLEVDSPGHEHIAPESARAWSSSKVEIRHWRHTNTWSQLGRKLSHSHCLAIRPTCERTLSTPCPVDLACAVSDDR